MGMHLLKRGNNGQSTLEYVLILTAVVGVIIWAAAGLIRPGVEKALTDADSAMKSAAPKLPN